MKRDLLIIWLGFLVVGLISWAILGNPGRRAVRMQTALPLDLGGGVLPVTNRSPYMRDER
jgi:hypothetical protein